MIFFGFNETQFFYEIVFVIIIFLFVQKESFLIIYFLIFTLVFYEIYKILN